MTDVSSNLPFPLPLHPAIVAPDVQRMYLYGPLIEFIRCSECNDLLIRNWDAGDYFCAGCGLQF